VKDRIMGDAFERLKARDEEFICRTYGRYPLAVKSGKGARLYDLEGREYLDLLSGIAVSALGHGHPALAEVVAEQMKRLVHVSNLFYTEEQVELAEKLVGTWSPGARAFFCNSGAEANEAAIKLARRYARKVKGSDAFEVLTLEGSFHGRTMATLTATGQDHVKDGFDPLPPGFRSLPFGDLDALKAAIDENACALMIEIVQGEYGVRILPEDYAKKARELCRERGLTFIVDEVQTGMCRTGRFWAHEHYGLDPDVITVAKPLAGGLPMGGILATEEASRGFEPGSHGTTFGGGPVLCRAACKVLEVMLEDRLAERAGELGAYALERLKKTVDRFPGRIKELRGLGLMVAVELESDGQDIWRALMDKGYILNLTKNRTLRLLPPLIIEQDDVESFASALEETLSELRP
jgi:acetylornithine aminotransferase